MGWIVSHPFLSIKESLACHTFITAVVNILEIAPARKGGGSWGLIQCYIKFETTLPCEVNGETEFQLG